MIDVLTLNYNDSDTTISFVKQILGYESISNILIVDNHSTDHSIERLHEAFEDSAKVIVIQAEYNGGYGSGNNIGIRYLSNHHSDYILLCNPDVCVSEKTVLYMEKFMEQHDYSIAAPFMCDKNGRRQYNSAFKIPTCLQYILSFEMLYSKLFHPCFYKDLCLTKEHVIDVDGVSGSLFIMRTKDMVADGMFDENIFLYAEEMVLSIKMKKANRRIALLADHSFIHNHSVSISKTFKSEVKKQKICLKSQLYVVKQYYRASGVIRLMAYLLAGISIIEHRIYNFLKLKH